MFSRLFFLVFILLITAFVSSINAATYTVDRADDVTATACTAAANDCSLRGAIANANANGTGADTINFNVGGGNFQTINITLEIPAITSSLTIDGTTQPLWGGLPLIEINGAGAAVANTDGFNIASPVSDESITVTIKSLVINRFNGNGIYSHCSSGCNVTIVGSYIGVNGGGSVDLGNGNSGIKIDAFPDSTFNIGGTPTSERNVISGNQDDGINVVTALGFTNGNTQVNVTNNFIGTSSAGNTDVGNSGDGISFGGPGFGYSLQVGNGLANGRNIISGNDSIGISAMSGTVTIVGNYIGTSLNGNADVGNTLDGIQLGGDISNATIGGTVIGIGVGNLISGNNRYGIQISDASIPATIRRNFIGTNAAGTADLGNSEDGIFLYENDTATNSAIIIGSDTNALDGNTISGNNGDGINVSEKVRQVKVFANKIGTNDAATAAIPNTLVGVRILSSQNEIGLAGNDTASNIISGNSSMGMMLVGSLASGNKVYNNYIGTNASGVNLGNSSDGIYINQSAPGNQIGNAAASGSNDIAFNGGNGVNVSDGSLNVIRVNAIYSNSGLGIDLEGNGVTLNDASDNDSGANSKQNFPVIQRATPSRITGFLDSFPGEDFPVDFYRVDSCDASGYGEGRYYLGTQTVLTSALTGIGDISFPTSLTIGQFITATATFTNAGAGDTSEFSQCVAVTGEPGNLSLSAATYSVNESSSARTIVVNRNGGSTGTITVNYTTSNGTATAGQDYTAQSGTFTFLNGEVVKSFDIPINNDALDENDETVIITLSNPPPGVFITPNTTAVLTITDNDNPPTISITDVTHEESNVGNTQFSFRVSLSEPSGLPIAVDFATADGTATFNSDYLPNNGQVNFAAGETLKNILVTVMGDLTPEVDETFFVNLSNPTNASVADNQAIGTIVDDDSPGKFRFSFAPYTGTEHQLVQVTVTRTNGDAGTVTVDYVTSGGTATPFTDYAPVSGTLLFGDGETVKTFNVSIADDTTPEPNESVNVVLSNPFGGAGLGVPSVATINIVDDDNGTLFAISGEVKKPDNSPLANATITLQGTQTGTITTDGNGKYSFPNLAPNGNYTVTPSAIGYTFTPVNREYTNLANDVLNANFTATPAPSRQLRIIGGNTTPGQSVNVVVELVAQGDENSVGFSLNFDRTILGNPQTVLGAGALTASLIVNDTQTGGGKYGILLALPGGQTFTAGTKSLVTITFTTSATNAYSSAITFGDAPIVRQIVNANADPLPSNYLDGVVTFAQGFEADVAPRPTGNNNGGVTVADFTQVGKFVAGLDMPDAPTPTNEFQRADCAPRISKGDGLITVSDYTQAGRYAVGLDAVAQSGGPSAAQSFAAMRASTLSEFAPTIVRVVNAQASAGTQVIVSIETDAQGTENGFGFTLNYDASKLSNPLVQKGLDTQTATLIPNTTQSGKVGVVLAMPFGEALPTGTKKLVTVRFNVAANATGGQTPLTFSDSPTVREVSDVDANVLTSVFQDGTINFFGATAANVSLSGRVTTANETGISKAIVSVTASNGVTFTALTNAFGYYRFDEILAGETYIVSVKHKYYPFRQSSRLLTALEDMENVNFTAEE